MQKYFFLSVYQKVTATFFNEGAGMRERIRDEIERRLA